MFVEFDARYWKYINGINENILWVDPLSFFIRLTRETHI